MLQAYPQRIRYTPILHSLVKAGRSGQKSGLGFYSYRNARKRAEPDPQAARILEPFVRHSDKQYSQELLVARLFLPMLLEATILLEEAVVRDVRDVDLGLLLGVGFPPSKGGLLFWADQLGAVRIMEMLEPLAELGPRACATPLLREMARTGRKFYDSHL